MVELQNDSVSALIQDACAQRTIPPRNLETGRGPWRREHDDRRHDHGQRVDDRSSRRIPIRSLSVARTT